MKKIMLSLFLAVLSLVVSAQSVTLRSHNNLVGQKRIPHKKLSAEQVALKNSIAFILYDWQAYSETLPARDAAKWKNKKLTPGLIKTRNDSLRINHKYTVISSKEFKNKRNLILEEQILKNNSRYSVTLIITASGWVVTKYEVAK